MKNTKLTVFVTVLATALFGVGCASTEPAFVKEGLVAHYPFNGDATDASGNGNDGRNMGAVPSEDRFMKKNRAYQFSGQDYINIDSKVLDVSGDFTLSAWVLFVGGGQNPRIFSVSSTRNGNVEVLTMGTGKQRRIGVIYRHRGHDQFSSKNISEGQWHQVAMVKNGRDISIFTNGLRNGAIETIKEGVWISDVGNIQIGRKVNQNTDYWGGKIDEVRIYNRALSAEEVKALYDLEKPKGK